MLRDIVAVASDHAGFALKQILCEELRCLGHGVLDCGTDDTGSVDYPDYAVPVAEALRRGAAGRGVVICGTGIGIAVAANRFPWVRAGVCHDTTSARLCRAHNDANVLALGARLLGPEVAKDCLRVFLDTGYEGGRHDRRIDKLTALPGAAASPCQP